MVIIKGHHISYSEQKNPVDRLNSVTKATYLKQIRNQLKKNEHKTMNESQEILQYDLFFHNLVTNITKISYVTDRCNKETLI